MLNLVILYIQSTGQEKNYALNKSGIKNSL